MESPTIKTVEFVKGVEAEDCSFTDSYYLPGYGYGTQLEEFLDLGAGASVNNLAMSGRSSYSFTTEANYKTLKAEIKAGDYLLIGFGHNDEKGEDGRYTNPNLTVDDNTQLAGRPVSFKNVLYNYYIKIAEEAGDTHVLSIIKTNQTVVVKYDNYEQTYTDFDFVATDNDYVYICLYATRGAGVTFTGVTYTQKGFGTAA